MNSNLNKTHYIMAENICRREYEKTFNFDLSLPQGHQQNVIFGTAEEMKTNTMSILNFWDELSNKHLSLLTIDDIFKAHPLKQAIYFLCQNHKSVWLEKLIELNKLN